MENKKKARQENKVLDRIKKFFNAPAPLIIVLITICAILLLYIVNTNSKNKIFVGSLTKGDVQVSNIHYFTNGDMNYFYATNANYSGEDKKVYSYQMGYYAVDKDNNYIELATRSSSLDKKTSIKDLISEMSGWNFAEGANTKHFFTNEVLKHMDNLHFVVKATTKKDTSTADFVIDYPIESTKITK